MSDGAALPQQACDVGDVSTAFYCVADERYFLGAVGLVNSLRLVGHDDPIFLLDCGLTGAQRELLAAEVDVRTAPGDSPPWLLKTVAPLARPAEVSVLVDTDMIATRALTELVERAREGTVIAFRDRQDRHFPEWGGLLGLGHAERRPYVSSGFVALGGDVREPVLRELDASRDAVDFERTFWRRNERDYPFLYADQDVLNAILSASLEADAVVALDNRLAPNPPYRGLRVTDAAELRCAYRDGTEPFVVHQYVRKPWLEATYDGVYSRLLRRLLTGDDVAVRVPEAQLPSRLRSGARARAERALVNARDYPRWRFGDRIPAAIGDRIEDRRKRS
jgi:hypothetical protein